MSKAKERVHVCRFCEYENSNGKAFVEHIARCAKKKGEATWQ